MRRHSIRWNRLHRDSCRFSLPQILSTMVDLASWAALRRSLRHFTLLIWRMRRSFICQSSHGATALLNWMRNWWGWFCTDVEVNELWTLSLIYFCNFFPSLKATQNAHRVRKSCKFNRNILKIRRMSMQRIAMISGQHRRSPSQNRKMKKSIKQLKQQLRQHLKVDNKLKAKFSSIWTFFLFSFFSIIFWSCYIISYVCFGGRKIHQLL